MPRRRIDRILLPSIETELTEVQLNSVRVLEPKRALNVDQNTLSKVGAHLHSPRYWLLLALTPKFMACYGELWLSS
jgi:hypothetical protein